MKLLSNALLAVALTMISSVDAFGVVSPPIQTMPSKTLTSLNASPENDVDPQYSPSKQGFPSWFSGMALATTLMLGSSFSSLLPDAVPPAWAEGSAVVGKLSGSGIIFKDTLLIERFEDPKVKGVVLYISNFDRPITEKLGGNFFNDPAYASVACAKTTKQVSIADNIAKGPGGEEVFEESRSLLFKTLRVQRVYDTDTNTVVYVSYNTRFDKNDDSNKSRFKSSLCAINLNDGV